MSFDLPFQLKAAAVECSSASDTEEHRGSCWLLSRLWSGRPWTVAVAASGRVVTRPYPDLVVAPRRQAALGSEASVLDDLVLARDAVGIARCGADRLQGTLYLLFGGEPWTAAQVVTARERLLFEVARTTDALALLNQQDACAFAAVRSVAAILGQPAGGKAKAVGLRRQALQERGCIMEPDSLRKREQPILRMIAERLYRELAAEQTEPMPTKDSIVRVLKPYAEMAAECVETAADLFAKRAALHDDAKLQRAIAAALWSVAQLGVLPHYGLQRLRHLGVTDAGDQAIEYLLEGITTVPFVAAPGDMNQLATAIQLGETAERFYDRLLMTPVMRPVVERFVLWMAGHDPKVCLWASNDVMVGYCGPHYYVSLCESLVEALKDYCSGALGEEMQSRVPRSHA